ncbi:MAG: gamma-glutamyltransferase [Pseudohongiellaceae bacterium]
MTVSIPRLVFQWLMVSSVTLTAASGSYGQADEPATAEEVAAELAGSDIRPEVSGTNAAVVSAHHLATQAGYDVLRAGGNAVDAAITMAGMLPALRPHMNGVGGDAWALFYDAETRQVSALNASGRAGEMATPEFFREAGHDSVPFTGGPSVTVPGAVSGWAAALERYGSISLEEALQPAINVARNGFVVSGKLAADLYTAAERLNDYGRSIFRPGEQPLAPGDLLINAELANSLEMIARDGPSALYGGPLGDSIAGFLQENGGHIRESDFANHEATWVTPVSVPFRDRLIYTVPPNSQGITLLQMMGMADQLDLEAWEPNSADTLHPLIEITKIAFADRSEWIADADHMTINSQRMIDEDYLARRLEALQSEAGQYDSGVSYINEGGDTVYLMVVDQEGNAVSWVQSLFGTFGSNLVDPGTGIVLQNRGAGFSLEDGHANQVAPGKRPFHTLMSTIVTHSNGDLDMTIGTPGGSGQPQFITQALIQMLIHGRSPQQAVEAPRFRIGNGVDVDIESRMPEATKQRLSGLGHALEEEQGWTANYGSLQVIRRLPSGVLRTGADMRREASVIAF